MSEPQKIVSKPVKYKLLDKDFAYKQMQTKLLMLGS